MKERVLSYLREVRSELSRITWPSRVELIALTSLVLVMVVILAIYIGLLDWIFREGARQLLR
ncbi:MAG: preprotein translocase subunit SecE [Candidatus Bipolaricaulota bacterium]|nr:preprotein translocase subunit SecE [Candidatus Bipolaricaulota bacterium]MCS7274954.1 preprotein translocase subunit SecE [Candidatus Bipolaricaulota bacterium]MDW8110198.1 preprotein translocase subunit SecE [Candidatus Bipolaricaulota bacterium]MDW8329712.1 preprotein translocase subunit SecE [Candidatus Bipolaricaulota bacterium]